MQLDKRGAVQDFPISLQEKKPDGKSTFNLEFELNQSEIVEFKKETGSNSPLGATLPVKIAIGVKNKPIFTLSKRGRPAGLLPAQQTQIGQFIEKRLEIKYIPAIREANSANEYVEEMVARELAIIVEGEAYKNALNDIERLQAPILAKISSGLKETLSKFLPAVKEVKIEISKEERFRALTSCSITVDDGTPTLLEFKGDGVKSLAVLSIMRHVSENSAKGKQLILAIEEPESHLHSNAIHQTNVVLHELAKRHQIVMTSHNPIFVDRQRIESTIIVERNRAYPAKDISKLRNILGVRTQDNLRNAEVILVVEGKSDKIALTALLSHAADIIKKALLNGKLAIDHLGGASNLRYKLNQHDDALCILHSFLDNDKAGKEAAKTAIEAKFLDLADVTYTILNKNVKQEAELEDMYDVSFYDAMILKDYGISLDRKNFKDDHHKWSDRLTATFSSQGKELDKQTKMKIKIDIAELITINPNKVLHAQKRTAFDALVETLKRKISKTFVK